MYVHYLDKSKDSDLILLTAFPLGQWISGFASLSIKEASLVPESYLYRDVEEQIETHAH